MFDISAFLVVACSWLAFPNRISGQQLDEKFTFYRCVGCFVVSDGYGRVWGSSSDPEKNCAAGKSDFCSGWMKRHKRRLTLICSKQSPKFCMMMMMIMIGKNKRSTTYAQRKSCEALWYCCCIGKDLENQLCVSFVCWISNASLNIPSCPLAFWSHSRLPLNPLQHEYSCTHHYVDDESSQGWLFSKASWCDGNNRESLQLLKIIHLWESQQSHSQKSQIHRRAVKRPWNMATKNASQLVCVFVMCISRAWSSFVTSCWDPQRLLSPWVVGWGPQPSHTHL